MGYDGYSIVGNTELNDHWKEQMKRAAQKAELKARIKNDIQEANQLFEAYLEHSFATTDIPNHHEQILKTINNLFDGKAKRALEQRFNDNIIKMASTNIEIELFIESFRK